MSDSEWQIFIVVPFSPCIMNRQHQFPINDLRGGKRNRTWQAKDILNQEWGFAQVCIGSKKSICTTCVKVCTCKSVPLTGTAINQGYLSVFITHKKFTLWNGLGHAHGKNPCEQYVLLLASEQLLFWGRCTTVHRENKWFQPWVNLKGPLPLVKRGQMH